LRSSPLKVDWTDARGLSSEERLRVQQTESGPRMASLAPWPRQQLDDHLVEPDSGLGTANAYMLKHWAELTLFLRGARHAAGQQRLRQPTSDLRTLAGRTLPDL
jgi:hypothetical protein